MEETENDGILTCWLQYNHDQQDVVVDDGDDDDDCYVASSNALDAFNLYTFSKGI